jgi:hypothetical protein
LFGPQERGPLKVFGGACSATPTPFHPNFYGNWKAKFSYFFGDLLIDVHDNACDQPCKKICSFSAATGLLTSASSYLFGAFGVREVASL